MKWSVVCSFFFILICEISTSHVVGNKVKFRQFSHSAFNSSLRNAKQIDKIPLEKLKHIFDNFNCSDGMTKCETLHAEEVFDYLKYNVTETIEGICLIIKPVKGGSLPWIHLEPLVNLTFLRRFQITTQQKVQKHKARMLFPVNFTQEIGLEELHVTMPLFQIENKRYTQFIKKLSNLKVLNFGYASELNGDNKLGDIIQSLQGKPLIALSLRAFQDISINPGIFMPTFNATQILWPLRNCPLQYLDLSQNGITQILPGINQVTQNLRILDISENNMKNHQHLLAIEIFLLHPSLEILNMSDQGCPGKYPDNYKTIQYEDSQKRYTDTDPDPSVNVLLEKCTDKFGINVTELKHNHTAFCWVMQCAVPHFFQGIPCSTLPSWSDLFPLDFSCTHFIRLPFSKHLKEINIANINALSRSTISTRKTILCFHPNALQKLIMSGDAMLLDGMYFAELINNTQLRGFENVTYLDFRFNMLQIPLENDFISSFPQLEQLYLGGNLVHTKKANICKRNKLLKTLDLSNNSLNTTLYLTDCKYLENLDISYNKLKTLKLKLNNIKFINASGNEITQLTLDEIQALEELGQKSNVALDMTNNPWDCGCSKQSLKSIQFMQKASQYNIRFRGFQTYRCVIQNTLISDVKVDQLSAQCYPDATLIYIKAVSGTMSVVIFVAMLFICFKCRYRINTCYFHTCRYLHAGKTQGRSQERIKYDAFVSYAAEDRFWVHDVLMPQLEGNCGLSLCLHYRDFPADGHLADVIIEKIQQSNSLLVILSRHSVVKPWCEYELKTAHAQHLLTGKSLIIVKLGEIPSGLQTTNLVKDLLNSHIYIQYPEVKENRPSAKDKKRISGFWLKLQKAIYGRDYCECWRYCNPIYKRNDSLRMPILDDYNDDECDGEAFINI